MTTDPVPGLASSTASSCLSAGARAAITSAITPQPMKTTATNTTRTAYSVGVGFRLGGKKRNITLCLSLQLLLHQLDGLKESLRCPVAKPQVQVCAELVHVIIRHRSSHFDGLSKGLPVSDRSQQRKLDPREIVAPDNELAAGQGNEWFARGRNGNGCVVVCLAHGSVVIVHRKACSQKLQARQAEAAPVASFPAE